MQPQTTDLKSKPHTMKNKKEKEVPAENDEDKLHHPHANLFEKAFQDKEVVVDFAKTASLS